MVLFHALGFHLKTAETGAQKLHSKLMKHLQTFSWLRGVEAAHLCETYQLNKSVSNTLRPGYLDQGGV